MTACGGGGGGTDAQASTSSFTAAPEASASQSTTGSSSGATGSESTGQASTETPGPFGQNAANYKLTFSDEFEGGSLDSNKWIDHEWYDQQRPINYAVEGGSLKIWPQKDENGNFFKRVINTDGKYYQTYGYFEMEAKLPHGKGVWPAFWLYNHDKPDPFRPEIDIMEAYSGGGPASGWSDANLKPTAFAATIWKGNPGDMAGHKMLQDLGDLSAGYHKYAMKWEPNKQTFYFDGKEIYSTTVAMPDRMYILVDILFGSASGQPDNTTPTGKSNSFDVKYVRAWQFK
ncbi:glycoside hydrolase family 16 protein [Noviherbaspirillum cavernae]|uniref:glycoside hydrolase family 16 protein n=1 Tax=Noviherbaspirillum cavernae TaxID=2320862 RepID=UPI001F5B9AC7|nr:glycoside hydrolase family 16 protein [Noviherbaspirillum cavernae]